MPAPDHLIPLLTALGDGGTVATADAVVAAAGGLPGQVAAPSLETVMGALGDGATRDIAGRVGALYWDANDPTADASVVNESTEPVTPELAEAIATTEPDLDDWDRAHGLTAHNPPPQREDGTIAEPASGGEDSDEDEWEASGLDEVAAPAETPAPEPVVNEPVGDHVPAATVRAWAKANAVKVPARGAIPQDVRDAYNAAQGAWRPGQTTSAIASEA